MENSNEKNIINFVNYGYIKCNLKEIMDKQNVTKTQMVKKTGLHHQIIDRYMSNDVIRLDKEVLAKLCYVLNCNINDIIIYVKPKD